MVHLTHRIKYFLTISNASTQSAMQQRDMGGVGGVISLSL